MNKIEPASAERLLNKVPEVTLYFWVIKIMATTVGETAADFLNTNLNLGLTNTSILMAALLVAALVGQFRKDRDRPGGPFRCLVRRREDFVDPLDLHHAP